MSDTVEVRVTGRQFRHDGEEYHTGDTLEVPERAISGWEARLERIDGDESSDEEDEGGDNTEGDEAESEGDAVEEEDGVEVDPHPSELTVPELKDRIAGVDDPDLLNEIRDAEEDSENRATAKDAIDARLNDLESGE